MNSHPSLLPPPPLRPHPVSQPLTFENGQRGDRLYCVRERGDYPDVSNNAHNHFHVWPLAEIISRHPGYSPPRRGMPAILQGHLSRRSRASVGSVRPWREFLTDKRRKNKVFNTTAHKTENEFGGPSGTLSTWTCDVNMFASRNRYCFSHFSSNSAPNSFGFAASCWKLIGIVGKGGRHNKATKHPCKLVEVIAR